ncbi:MAG: YqaJ viral recombinase family protein [Xanthobacteraceae bacterium]
MSGRRDIGPLAFGPEDLSWNLVVQLGAVTEEPNRRWYEANTGQVVVDVQAHIRHPALHWMAAALDGRVEASAAVFEAKFMLAWYFSAEAAAEKYAPQLQHNMWVAISLSRNSPILPAMMTLQPGRTSACGLRTN